MRDEWSFEDLVESWTFVAADWVLIANRAGPTRLGFALSLKFFELEARFPFAAAEFASSVLEFVAVQVKVAAERLVDYDWDSRSATYHRAQIRESFGFRVCTRADENDLAAWLGREVCPIDSRQDTLLEALRRECRSRRLEPPGRVERIVGSARNSFEVQFSNRTLARLNFEQIEALERLVAEATETGLLADLKSDPGQLGLETLLREIAKLTMVRALNIPTGLFAEATQRTIDGWRSRAARAYRSDLLASPQPVRVTLVAALCWSRRSEITDALVDLLLGLVHKINTHADRRVERELIADLRRVRGKEQILFRVAEVAVEHPDGTIRDVVYPVVDERTLRDLVREARAEERVFNERVRTVLRSSYSSYYRRMLPALLSALTFRSNNTGYRPVLDAIELLKRYASTSGKSRYYEATDTVPLDGVVPKSWRPAVIDDRGRVERIPYELCVLVALRDAIRRREVFIDDARRWRDPDHDLPADFEASKDVHYESLRQPTDPEQFINGLRERMRHALTRFDKAITDDSCGGVRIVTRHSEPWITVPRMDALPEPVRLEQIKAEVQRRWGTLDLLDVLKDSDFLCEFTNEFASTASREVIDRDVLRRRLLLALFALGTNMGIKGVVSTGDHGESETALRYVRRHYITRDNLRRAITRVVNATFDARDPRWWGHRHRVRVGLEEVRVMGIEPDDRMAQPLRRTRCDDLLARRTTIDVHLQPTEELLLIRSRRDDRRPPAPRHRRTRGEQLRRHPRRVARRVRVHRTPRLPAPPTPEEHRLDPPLPAQRHNRAQAARKGDHQADPVGPHRSAVRPDDPLRHRPSPRHHRRGNDPATLHTWRTETPHVPSARRTRRTESCSTANTATSPDPTANTPKPPCFRCTSCSRRSCTSTHCSSKPCSKSPSSTTASARTNAED